MKVAGDVARPGKKKKKKLRPLRGKEKRGKFGKPKSEDDLAFFPTGAGQKRKFTLLDTNKSVWKVTWRLLSFPCKLFYIFTHFSFPLFFFFFFFWLNSLFTGAKWLANLTVSVIVQLDFKLSEQLPQKARVDKRIQTPGTRPQWGVSEVQGRQWRQREGSVH